MKRTIPILIALVASVLCPAAAFAGPQEGIAAMNRGDYETAYKEFSALAAEGDDRAMITIGLWYHQGEGFEQDYGKAFEWYLQAYELGNGDAYNNLGVMYRDGLGVPVNRSVSYALFLLTHLRSLGSESTQYRANGNLRREIQETTEEQRALAFCMTEAYLSDLVRSKGTLEAPSADQLPSETRPRIKDDTNLWLDSERKQLDEIQCPAPWDEQASVDDMAKSKKKKKNLPRDLRAKKKEQKQQDRAEVEKAGSQPES